MLSYFLTFLPSCFLTSLLSYFLTSLLSCSCLLSYVLTFLLRCSATDFLLNCGDGGDASVFFRQFQQLENILQQKGSLARTPLLKKLSSAFCPVQAAWLSSAPCTRESLFLLSRFLTSLLSHFLTFLRSRVKHMLYATVGLQSEKGRRRPDHYLVLSGPCNGKFTLSGPTCPPASYLLTFLRSYFLASLLSCFSYFLTFLFPYFLTFSPSYLLGFLKELPLPNPGRPPPKCLICKICNQIRNES